MTRERERMRERERERKRERKKEREHLNLMKYSCGKQITKMVLSVIPRK